MRIQNAAHRRKTLVLATTAALAFSMQAAHAGYYVSTDANTGGGYNRGCAATYNYVGTGAAFVVNDGSNGPCPTPTATFNNQLITTSGTTDKTGKLTSSTDASTVTSLAGSYSAAANASADLKKSQVHLYATAAGPLAGAEAQAHLDDTLHFTIAGASADTVTLIPVSFSFDGKLIDGSDPTHSSATLLYGFTFGNASASEYGYYGAGYYAPPRYPAFVFPEATPSRTYGWQSYHFASYTPTDTRFTGLYAVTGATATIPIDFGLDLQAAGLTLDYLNTGTISVGKVAGVAYTSDSGVFGTGGTVSTPEPASMVLFGCAVGIAGLAAGHRRAA